MPVHGAPHSVPPAPPAAFDDALLGRVEDAGLNASAPPAQRWLDGWLLRTLPGKARRARCVHALAPGRLALDERLARAAEVYREAGVPMIFRLHRFSQPSTLDAELAARGYAAVDETCVMVATTLPTAMAPLPAGVAFEPLDGEAFAEAVGLLRGSPPAHRASHALRLAHSPVAYRGWALRRQEDGAVLACGQYAAEAELVGLYDVFTHPAARNEGLARLLCERMLASAAQRGAQIAYLQVDAGNAPALAVYRRLGFAEGYRYHYRDGPGA